MVERYATQKVFSMAWPRWDEVTGKPDLSPSHINALLRSERIAFEYAANQLLSDKAEEYNLDEPISDLFDAAFNQMDMNALKILNKVFKIVTDEFYTLEFVHPTNKFPVFKAYAYPLLGLKLIAIYTTHIKQRLGQSEDNKDIKRAERTNQVKNERAQPVNLAESVNGCVVMPPDFNIPICSCVVDGQEKCKYWKAPEDIDNSMCFYQVSNEEAQGADDLVACLNEDAVTELENSLSGKQGAPTPTQEVVESNELPDPPAPKRRGRPAKKK